MGMKYKTARDVMGEANCGIVGIDEALDVFGGYDEQLVAAATNRQDWWAEGEGTELPPAERIALADEMIRRWTAYRDIAKRLG